MMYAFFSKDREIDDIFIKLINYNVKFYDINGHSKSNINQFKNKRHNDIIKVKTKLRYKQKMSLL